MESVNRIHSNSTGQTAPEANPTVLAGRSPGQMVVDKMNKIINLYNAGQLKEAHALGRGQESPQAAYAHAHFILAEAYERGRCVNVNRAAAIDHYEAASAAGNLTAKYRIAWMYDIGNGLPKDTERAIGLYKELAAAQEKEKARLRGVGFNSEGRIEEMPRWHLIVLLHEAGRTEELEPYLKGEAPETAYAMAKDIVSRAPRDPEDRGDLCVVS